ncbi:MAG: hypothetical protein H7287_04765, partial [Thermoleophilia bacterium]|nr:hypothetical protein [Thermoleophilia bacterium]
VLAGAAVVLLVVDWMRVRGYDVPSFAGVLRRIALPIALVAAVASLGMVGIVGHLGAKAAWHNSLGASAKVRAE